MINWLEKTDNELLIYSSYYAPRGRYRLYKLAGLLSQRYVLPIDYLVGIIGAEGSGKSTLIKGLFPGMELTNDDDGVNLTPAPIYDFEPDNYLSGHTFHIDIRYELAFKQQYEIVDAINKAISHGRRVVVEHFDLIYKALGYNAQLLFGIGEEVLVARPSVFGPFPPNIKHIVDKTIKFRLMAHSAEDITSYILEKKYNFTRPVLHSDIKHGFVINFNELPKIDINELENNVMDIIKKGVSIYPVGEDRIGIGDFDMLCTGTRTHVKKTSDIENFRLIKEYRYNPISKTYLLIGTIGKKEVAGFEDILD
ncbi:MAG: alanine-tRNA synthetase second additional domain-containing protein [Spirochaetes bacterium]|nr:alanine-tRNA synthetase second additional domain-containing protein [Spirochaetota bacterium]